MESQLPIVILSIPFIVALGSAVLGVLKKSNIFRILSWAYLANLLLSFKLLQTCLDYGFVSNHFAGWETHLGISFKVNPIFAALAILINFIAFIVALFAYQRWSELSFSLFSILCTAFLGLLFSNDLFNIYVFIEVSALSAYALMAIGGNKAALAVYKYLILGVCAATFYLLGLGLLYSQTGYLNIDSTAHFLRTENVNLSIIHISIICFFVGLAIKSALFPMHTWMPSVYTFAPSYMVAFISSLMTKMNIIIFFKLFFIVFPHNLIPHTFWPTVQVLALLGVFYGAYHAYKTSDARQMFAYSSISQIGLIFLGFSLQSSLALFAAFFHIIIHALMKTAFFLISEQTISQARDQNLSDFKALSKQSRWLAGLTVVSGASMVGLPPFPGFFSKFYLVLTALEQHNYILLVLLVFASLATANYIFKFIQICFEPSENPEQENHKKLSFSKKLIFSCLLFILVGISAYTPSLKKQWLNYFENHKPLIVYKSFDHYAEHRP
ncbi:MAG TPA: proton-conducting transporter membrane subunit [Oligoflexia bacterium]|nr:proton-conducting transporter membrane subunit [Oligoflexia bacterium]HMR24731.1 proton-conducting transporter membrane subunit [Oligoflexia bacterium]